MFFRSNIFQVNSITFRFSFSLTLRHTNYQTIKFLRLYLQDSRRNEKQIHETSGAATQRFSAKWVLWHFNPKINAWKIPVNQLIFLRIGIDLQLYYSRTLS